MSSLNIGDIVFQLFSFVVVIVMIALVISLFRSYGKRKNQLDRIEKKLDDLNQEIKGKPLGGNQDS